MNPSELVLMASLGLSPGEAVAELRRLEPALVNLEYRHPAGQGQVAAQTLNVRERPGVDAKILGRLALAALVRVWGRTADGQWLVIEADDGLAGWVSREWVRLAE